MSLPQTGTSGFIIAGAASRRLPARAYCTFAACTCIHPQTGGSAFPVQQMRAECDLIFLQTSAVILAWCSLQVGWRPKEPSCLLAYLSVCGTDVAWQHRNIVSTNPRDVQMPRKTCMAAGPALICSNQGTVDDVRYPMLACPEETPQTKEVRSPRLDARERGSITRRREDAAKSVRHVQANAVHLQRNIALSFSRKNPKSSQLDSKASKRSSEQLSATS